jgi:hypothetical protein
MLVRYAAMTTAMWIILAVIVICVIAFRAFVRWHQRWLEQQTPLGAWTTSTPEGAITLVRAAG